MFPCCLNSLPFPLPPFPSPLQDVLPEGAILDLTRMPPSEFERVRGSTAAVGHALLPSDKERERERERERENMTDAAGVGVGASTGSSAAASASTAAEGMGGKDEWAVTALQEFLEGGATVSSRGQVHSLQSQLLSAPPGFDSEAEFPPLDVSDVSVP